VLAQDIKVGVNRIRDRAGRLARHSGAQPFPLMPQTIGGKKVHYIVAPMRVSDTTTAVKNTRKADHEDKVDVIVGSTSRQLRWR